MSGGSSVYASHKWHTMSYDEQKAIQYFFAKTIKPLPVDILLIRQTLSSFRDSVQKSIETYSLRNGVLIALVSVNVLVLLCIFLYYNCGNRVERSSDKPPCVCSIEATNETMGKKLKSKLKARDYTYLRFTNVPQAPVKK